MKTFIKWFMIVLSINFLEGSFRCDYKYSPRGKGWFKLFVVPATWFDARLRCTLEGAILASPTPQEVRNEMRLITTRFFSESEIFTGIHASFSKGDYYTVNGVPLSQLQAAWAKNEPNNLGNNESCITMNNKGDLADRNCMVPRPYICYRPNNEDVEINECGTVDPEYFLDERTGSCYKFHTVPRVFDRVFFTCSAEGGHLAIINSETEVNVIKDLFAKYPGIKMVGNFWKDVAFVGFQDWGEHGEWRTIHGQTLSEAGFGEFSAGEPNNSTGGEFCGSVYRNGLLNDVWCHHSLAFICEKRPDYPPVCEITKEE